MQIIEKINTVDEFDPLDRARDILFNFIENPANSTKEPIEISMGMHQVLNLINRAFILGQRDERERKEEFKGAKPQRTSRFDGLEVNHG